MNLITLDKCGLRGKDGASGNNGRHGSDGYMERSGEDGERGKNFVSNILIFLYFFIKVETDKTELMEQMLRI
jgi:hypothetical protein